MSRLADQEVVIEALAREAGYRRVRAEEACRTLQPSSDYAMKSTGAVLTAAEITPALVAIVGLIFGKQEGRKQRERLVCVALETPRLVRVIQRFLPGRADRESRK